MRIAIVNDMPNVVEALELVLAEVPDYKVAWIACNGTQAVTKCAADTPDLILIDLLMPVMDGVEVTRQIMNNSPCAILLLTATVNGDTSKVFEAMGYGALDAVHAPILGHSGQIEGGAGILEKIATIGKLIGKTSKPSRRIRERGSFPSKFTPPLIVIGSSTGGPQALAVILSGLPANFSAAVVIVQHVDEQFTSGLAEWLNTQSRLPVKLAQVGSQIQVGQVLIAATNDHLILQPNLSLRYTKEPRDYPYRPSVDVFFKSVAQHWTRKGVAVLLTGMGRDGAQGLLSLRSAGWYTIAQDQATSVVYGMPKAAVELKAAVEILPIEAIAKACEKQLLRPIF
ncbi:chemotaxis-specific protein-glutamate methyltransferase CheB [Scytonema sp. UIC 10036]|uniref:chemotaxis response regulator protein-glutamate methylesterase n=1 Tax=Scytonema sp. UIC 10036 TaxID=2304196 RepID=UPI0012DAC6B9|nr:chemotaxis response regulator protein-glutamate methylesterase [Scytonema sp. UIC 10036]MUG91073.1 chemotaxis-specific protein-glutamate methyltransferase CheB [Scytonema sp. UIC 10036]